MLLKRSTWDKDVKESLGDETFQCLMDEIMIEYGSTTIPNYCRITNVLIYA